MILIININNINTTTNMKFLILLLLILGAYGFNCTDPLVDCNYHGVCNTHKTKCVCDDRYDTFNSLSQCNYKKKEQSTAFALHFFTGIFGGGHFYIDNLAVALSKLLLFVPGTCITVVLVYHFTEDVTCSKLFSAIYTSLLLIWWSVDIILFAMNYYRDGNGISLYPW